MRAFYQHKKKNIEIKTSEPSLHNSNNDSMISNAIQRDNDVACVVVSKN